MDRLSQAPPPTGAEVKIYDFDLSFLFTTTTTMGRLRHKRTHHARRDVQRGARTRARTKDLDQIQHDIEHSRKKMEKQPIDEDKPGLGQHVGGVDGEGGERGERERGEG